MKTKSLLVLVIAGLVAVFGSGCVAFNAGGTNKSAHISPDGSFHERHSSWNLSDPLTGTCNFLGKLVDVNCEVNINQGPGYYSRPVYNHPGSYYDYRYNGWCTRGSHYQEINGHRYEVPDGCHVEQRNGSFVNVRDKD